MKLRLILGDQLSDQISSLQNADPEDIVMLAEVVGEATYVKHHKKKIAFLFAAMRQFHAQLQARGLKTRYVNITDSDNTGSLTEEVARAIHTLHPSEVIVTEPGEYRVLQDLRNLRASQNIPITILRDTRFLASIADFRTWAEGRKSLRMEFFYREMRRKFHVLMEGDQPIGGKWNYDAENRKPPKSGLNIPPPFKTEPDEITTSAIADVGRLFPDHFGSLDDFHYATTREKALDAFSDFVTHRLPFFGSYQDAMITGEPWMFHSHISLYLNCGLLEPLEVIERVEQAYHNGHAPLNAVEGFIRQILGWREYVRGVYWTQMPNYAHANYLEATRKLPSVYWGADTRMACMKTCVAETAANAYAHHIQRLMVLGNFALLAGLDPIEVNEWYLVVYADAYEWVEMPNVTGMVLFADGGLLGSKPYAASGAYINRMSDYCSHCSYKVAAKSGADACPFNYLYWDFLDRNAGKLSKNPRLAMPYRTLAKFDDARRTEIRSDAARFLRELDNGKEV
ncbi:MAG: cryptochrome/photolyase family protein [Pseudomonadota bacterium]